MIMRLFANTMRYFWFLFCPIGFHEIKENPRLCYVVKHNVSKFSSSQQCNDNITPLDFYILDNYTSLMDPEKIYWTNYVRAYEGGPFIDNVTFTGLLPWDKIENVNNSASLMCAGVKKNTDMVIPMDCEERLSFFCQVFLSPRVELNYTTKSTFAKFRSPLKTNLEQKKFLGQTFISWYLYSKECMSMFGFLPQRSYIYLHIDQEMPLGIRIDKGIPTWLESSKQIPINEWNFANITELTNFTGHVSLFKNKWMLRNDDHVYNATEIFCEYPVDYNLTTSLLVHKGNEVYIQTNDSSHVTCFTDSFTYYPIMFQEFHTTFMNTIKMYEDGYYWCFVGKNKGNDLIKTNSILYIRDKENNKHRSSVKVKLLNPPSKDLIPFLASCILGDDMQFSFINSIDNPRNFKEETKAKTENNGNETKTMKIPIQPKNFYLKVKKIYQDNTILFHTNITLLDERLKNSSECIEPIFVRKLQSCTSELLPEGQPGDVRSNMNGRYICKVDFNEGGHWEYQGAPLMIQDFIVNFDDLLKDPVHEQEFEIGVNAIDNIISNNVNLRVRSETLLNNLEKLANQVIIAEEKTFVKIEKPNLGIVVTDRETSDSRQITGIKVSRLQEGTLNNSIKVLTEGDPDQYDDDTELSINIPTSLGDKNARLTFMVFVDDKLFNTNENVEDKINSRILSVSITNTSIFEAGQFIDVNFRPLKENIEIKGTKQCVYWNTNESSWSGEGCELFISNDPNGLDTCRCYHLTHFAQLITPNHIFGIHHSILQIISIVGCVLSLTGVVIIIITGIFFKKWRDDASNKIKINLSLSVGIVALIFLCVTFIDLKNSFLGCMALGMILHYSVLASFGWMLLSAVSSYRRLVKVFYDYYVNWYTCIFAWLWPACPVLILYFVNFNSYTHHYTELRSICYPSGMGLIFSVVLPISLILVINTVLYFYIVGSVFCVKSSVNQNTGSVLSSITISCALFYFFGLTWIFGLFAEYIILAYLFCLTATLQGAVLFTFFIIGNKHVREFWLKKLHIKHRRKYSIPSNQRSRKRETTNESESIQLYRFKRNTDS